MMLSFWLSQHIYKNQYVLSELHNQTHFPPTAIILWFDQNGEFLLLKTWAIIGDILSSIIVYFVIKKITKKNILAILGLTLVMLNPVSIYESAFWGQNDIIGSAFAYISLFSLVSSIANILAIPLFFIGLSLKPTIAILTPIFILIFIKIFKPKLLFNQFIGLILGISTLLVSFLPFLNQSPPQLGEINTIISHRISPSSKGVIRASNSAFNFYSLFYTLDRTPGNFPFLFFNLNTLGILFYLIIITKITVHLIKNKPSTTVYLFYIFFISQGAFIFMTSMLERYFFPAFIASIVLMVINYKKTGKYFIIQNILWFLNLVFSRPESILLVKALSFLSITNYLIISYVFYFKDTK
jgi:Gpi18-like mannosyltransferase